MRKGRIGLRGVTQKNQDILLNLYQIWKRNGYMDYKHGERTHY